MNSDVSSVDALVKTFEKLEHRELREKRKKDDPLPDPAQFTPTSASTSTATSVDRRWKRKKSMHASTLV